MWWRLVLAFGAFAAAVVEVVAMSPRRKLFDWEVPATEWERFDQYITREYGDYDGELVRHVEAAMREYADLDADLAAVERTLDAHLSCGGGGVDTAEEEKQQHRVDGTVSLANAPTTRIRRRIHPDVLAAFKERVDEAADDDYGVELARALRQYRTHPRASRVRAKYERLHGSVENDEHGSDATHHAVGSTDSAAAASSDDPDADGDHDQDHEDDGDGDWDLSTRDGRVTAAAAQLREVNDTGKFHVEKDLRPLLTDFDAISDDPAPQTVEQYAADVAAELGAVESPRCADLYVPADEIPERPDHIPWECWVPVTKLNGDPEARARRVRLEVGYRAATDGGSTGLTIDEILEEVLDDAVCKRTARTTMEAAADGVAGIEQTTSPGAGIPVLEVDLNRVKASAPDLYNEIVRYYRGEEAAAEDAADADTAESKATDTDADGDVDADEATPTATAAASEPGPESEAGSDPDLDPLEQVASQLRSQRGVIADMGLLAVRRVVADALETEPDAVADADLRAVIERADLWDLVGDDVATDADAEPDQLAATTDSDATADATDDDNAVDRDDVADDLERLENATPVLESDGGEHQPQTQRAEPVVVHVEAD